MATVTPVRDCSDMQDADGLSTIAQHAVPDTADIETATAIETSDEFVPVSHLAALLDQFTANITNPEAHTLGSFAHTIQALHSELAMLARNFGGEAPSVDGQELEFFDFDDVSDDVTTTSEPIEPGIAAAEELEHLCRQLSRG
jgi:hypothetical protein